jgi:hypothetical protein
MVLHCKEKDDSKYGKLELVPTATGNQHEPCSSHVDVQCKPCERHNPCNEPHDIVLLCRVRRDWAGLRAVAEKKECKKKTCLEGGEKQKWIHHVACSRKTLIHCRGSLSSRGQTNPTGQFTPMSASAAAPGIVQGTWYMFPSQLV